MDISTLTDAVDEMCRTWAAFQHENDRASGRNEESLGKMNARMNQLESAIRRERRTPMISGDAREYGPETKAYFDYLRHGTRDEPTPGAESLTREEMKALTVGTDPTAGYLAPVEYAREIIKGEIEFSPLRTIARVRPTSRRAVQMPKRSGTFGAVWTAESGTRAETTGLSYGLEEFPTHEMYALVDVSEQMMEDSEFSLEAELQQEFSEQFAVTEGAAFVNGNGVGKPEGLLQHADVAETTSGSASSIGDSSGQADGMIDLYHGLKTAYAVNGTWLLNRATLSEVRKLKDSQNNYIWQPGLASAVPNTILGHRRHARGLQRAQVQHPRGYRRRRARPLPGTPLRRGGRAMSVRYTLGGAGQFAARLDRLADQVQWEVQAAIEEGARDLHREARDLLNLAGRGVPSAPGEPPR